MSYFPLSKCLVESFSLTFYIVCCVRSVGISNQCLLLEIITTIKFSSTYIYVVVAVVEVLSARTNLRWENTTFNFRTNPNNRSTKKHIHFFHSFLLILVHFFFEQNERTMVFAETLENWIDTCIISENNNNKKMYIHYSSSLSLSRLERRIFFKSPLLFVYIYL